MSGAEESFAATERRYLRFHRRLQDQSLAKVLRLLDVLGYVEKDIVRTGKKMDATATAGRQKQEALREGRKTYGVGLYGSYQLGSLQLSAVVQRFSNDILDFGQRLTDFFDGTTRHGQFIIREHDRPDGYVLYLKPSECDALPDSLSKLGDHPIFQGLFTSIEATDTALETAASDYESAQADLNRSIAPSNNVAAALVRQTESWSATLSLTDLDAGRFPAKPEAVQDTPDHVLHSAVQPHIPQRADELRVKVGDRLIVIERFDNGWFYGFNLTAEAERPEQQSLGCFPSSSIDGMTPRGPASAPTSSTPPQLPTAVFGSVKLGAQPLHPVPGLVDSTIRYLKFRRLIRSFTFLALGQFMCLMSKSIQATQRTLASSTRIATRFRQIRDEKQRIDKEFAALRQRRALLSIRHPTGPAANTRSAKCARDAASASPSHPSPHDPVASTSTAVIPPAHLSFHRQLQEDAQAKLLKLSDELEEVEILLDEWDLHRFGLFELLDEQDELVAEVVRERQQHRADVNAFSARFRQEHAQMTAFTRAMPLRGLSLALYLSAEQQAALPVSLSELEGHGILEALPAGHDVSQNDLDTAKNDFEQLAKEASEIGQQARSMAESWAAIFEPQEGLLEEWSISKDALAEYAVKHSQLNKDYPMVHLAICDHAPKASDELRIEADDRIRVLEVRKDGWDFGYNLTAHEQRPKELRLGFFPWRCVLLREGASQPLFPRTDSNVLQPDIKLSNLDAPPALDCIERRFAFQRLVSSIQQYAGCVVVRLNNEHAKRTIELNATFDRLQEAIDRVNSEQAWMTDELDWLDERIALKESRRLKIVERRDDQIISLVILSRRPASPAPSPAFSPDRAASRLAFAFSRRPSPACICTASHPCNQQLSFVPLDLLVPDPPPAAATCVSGGRERRRLA
uniref:BY PROTMAP: gi/342320349/gb/EGU12290.1/ Proteophosphoglycan ppg4 [Rhodotorula glutinis ATCC 204091] n=1 Tax=Rhodotorula toruloides TaxID=5286 RepID=A0A0K3CW21_RHOTO